MADTAPRTAESPPKVRDRTGTILRMAGNIAAGLVTHPPSQIDIYGSGEDHERIARIAVSIAYWILEKVEAEEA